MIDNIAYAEGSYAAKGWETLKDNPYPVSHIYHTAWNEGFVASLINLRADLRVTQQAYGNAIDARRKLQAKYDQLMDEFNTVIEENGL